MHGTTFLVVFDFGRLDLILGFCPIMLGMMGLADFLLEKSHGFHHFAVMGCGPGDLCCDMFGGQGARGCISGQQDFEKYPQPSLSQIY